MAAVRIPAHLLKAFVEEGLVPPGTHDIELTIPADGALTLRYTRYVGVEHLGMLARIFSTMEARTRDAQT